MLGHKPIPDSFPWHSPITIKEPFGLQPAPKIYTFQQQNYQLVRLILYNIVQEINRWLLLFCNIRIKFKYR